MSANRKTWKEREAERHREIGKTMWSVVALVFVLYVLGAVLTFSVAMFRDVKPGEFGDAFGALNTFFSGLAFGFVILTVWLQTEELRYQRIDLRRTRKVLRDSREAQQKSEKALATQAETLVIAAQLNAATSIAEYHGRAKVESQGMWKMYQEGEEKSHVQLQKILLLRLTIGDKSQQRAKALASLYEDYLCLYAANLHRQMVDAMPYFLSHESLKFVVSEYWDQICTLDTQIKVIGTDFGDRLFALKVEWSKLHARIGNLANSIETDSVRNEIYLEAIDLLKGIVDWGNSEIVSEN